MSLSDDLITTGPDFSTIPATAVIHSISVVIRLPDRVYDEQSGEWYTE